MNKTIFHLVLFSLLLNIATGIMTVLVVDVDGHQVFTQQDKALVPVYDSSGNAFFMTQANQKINPAGVTEDKGNLVFRLLDLVGLGFINQILTIVYHYLYGFVNLLNSLFGPWLINNKDLYTLLFGLNLTIGSGYVPVGGLLNGIITLGYVTGMWELWTNKSITD